MRATTLTRGAHLGNFVLALKGLALKDSDGSDFQPFAARLKSGPDTKHESHDPDTGRTFGQFCFGIERAGIEGTLTGVILAKNLQNGDDKADPAREEAFIVGETEIL